MKRITLAALIAIFMLSPVHAREVQKVQLPESVTVAGTKLSLNGAGIRKKFFVKVYVGALYLEQPANSAAQVFVLNGPNRVAMHILHSKIKAEKLTGGWDDGFQANHSGSELAKLSDRLKAFNAFFVNVEKGDTLLFDYIPGTGTQVTINGKLRGSVPGKDFNTALLKVWLGDEPASSDLKKGMLAGSR